MVLVDQPKEIPAKAEVDSQLAGELDVVVTIHTVIVFAVVRKRDVGEVDLSRATEESNCAAIRSASRC